MAMLRAYVGCGLDPASFWTLTPRLYLAHMRGAADRLEDKHRNRAWLAWHVEALSRQKKLPDAKTFIGAGVSAPQQQSPEVLEAMCSALAAAWGAKAG